MQTTLATIPIRNFSNGIMQMVDDKLVPQNTVTFAMNLLFDKYIGRAVLREGTALIGAQIADTYSVLGLHQFILQSGTKYFLANVNGASYSSTYRLETGTWTDTGSDGRMTLGAKVRFMTFLDTVAMFDGTLKKSSVDGTAWVTVAGNLDIGNAPAGKFAIEWKDQVYTAGVSNLYDRLFYSSTPYAGTTIVWHWQNCDFTTTDLDTIAWGAGQLTTPGGTVYQIAAGNTGNMAAKTYIYLDINVSTTAYQVTTTASTAVGTGKYLVAVALNNATAATVEEVGNGGFIDIEPYSGMGNITGLAKVPGYLLIFKERGLKRWNGASTFPEDLVKWGTPSQESVVLGSSTVYYFSASYKTAIGFYETNGESTRKISRPIQTLVEAISSSNYTEVAGFSDGETAMWSVGDITFEGIAYTNVVLLYHIGTQTWTALSFPTKFTVFSPYIDSTTLKIAAGNNDGEVIEVFTGDKDNITGSLNMGIAFALQCQVQDLGSRSNVKELQSIVPYTHYAKDTQISVRKDETDIFRGKGKIKNDFETEIPLTGLRGHTFEFRFEGVTKAGLTQIIGFDLIEPEMSNTIKVS